MIEHMGLSSLDHSPNQSRSHHTPKIFFRIWIIQSSSVILFLRPNTHIWFFNPIWFSPTCCCWTHFLSLIEMGQYLVYTYSPTCPMKVCNFPKENPCLLNFKPIQMKHFQKNNQYWLIGSWSYKLICLNYWASQSFSRFELPYSA